uniref:C2H2-type domain-containing protein n=1 Tax=Anopheles dirus TaxID=7168 RepID=A0A182NBJ1_9DIPT
MKKGVETATTKVVAAAAAAAAAASLAENSDLWAQQDWIKNILSKTGTEIKEVPAEDLCKMVYYSGLPLLMTQQQQQQQQLGPDGAILQLNYNDANSADQYAAAGQPARNGGPNPYQQSQHHSISLTNGLTISNGPQGCSSSNSSSSSSSSNNQLTIVLNPPAHGQSYPIPLSPLGEGRATSPPEQSGGAAGPPLPQASPKFRCDQCNISFGSKSAHTSHMKSHAKHAAQQAAGGKANGDKTEAAGGASEDGAGRCKVEDVSSGASSGVDGGPTPSAALDGNSSSGGSNSNSSFEYSSSCTERRPVRGPSSRIEEEEELEDDEDDEGDEEDDEHDRKRILPYGPAGAFAYDGVRASGGGGVAPALLAAASIAAAVENGCGEMKYCPADAVKQQRTISPPSPAQQQSALSITRITPPPSSGSSSSSSSSSSSHSANMTAQSSLLEPGAGAGIASGSSAQFGYEPITSIMKHHGYFAPASQITEFRSSSDIVRQVEAAIAGTENLLTPPRSSPESPDRSSSPESDSVLMADRDNNTLPPRKRKLYFKDSQQTASAPKLASLEVRASHAAPAPPSAAPQHYSVMMLPEAHAGPPAHQQQQQLFVADHHAPVWPGAQQRSVKLEGVASSREQRVQPPSPPPPQPAPQPQPQASVIRMSSVIQYANKSS